MTTEANVVIGNAVAHACLMRIVTSETRDPTVALRPAGTPFQTIRLKAKIADAERLRQGDVHESAVTGAAKIHQIHGIKTAGIENRSQALPCLLRLHRGDMPGARTVAGFAGHAENEAAGIEVIARS